MSWSFYPLGPVQDWWGKLRDWITYEENKYFLPPVSGGLAEYYLGDKTQTKPLPPGLVDAIIQASALRYDQFMTVDWNPDKVPHPSTQQGRQDLYDWGQKLLIKSAVDPFTFKYNMHKFLYDHPEWNPVEWETFTDPDNKRENPYWDPGHPYGNPQGNLQWLYTYIPSETARSKQWWANHSSSGNNWWNSAFWATFNAEWTIWDFFKGLFQPGLWEDLVLLAGPLFGLLIFAEFRTTYSY